jgi:hypothetical protein
VGARVGRLLIFFSLGARVGASFWRYQVLLGPKPQLNLTKPPPRPWSSPTKHIECGDLSKTYFCIKCIFPNKFLLSKNTFDTSWISCDADRN